MERGHGTIADEHAAVAALVRRYRVAAGLSQEELARRAGLGVTTIAALERGRSTAPRPETVLLLATALGLEARDRAALIAAARKSDERGGDRPAVTNQPATDELATERPTPTSSVLPVPPTALIGREREVAALAHLLGPRGARVLTLTGPGGVGKTRLALAVASAVQESYADGVAFVDLSPLRDAALVAPTIARVLGLRVAGARDAGALLAEHLRDKNLLLVLDNVEQVVEAAELVAKLVADCPRLVVLATSRAALRVRAEQRFDVPPLATPEAGQETVDTIAGSAAVRLFVARARAIHPTFTLDATNAMAVARVCRQLDGLPLAIELAAARVALLPPAALSRRLERRLPMLQGGARDLPERQRTLRATLDWSFDLLSPGERQLFVHLAVFRGGGTLDAVEAICDPDGALDVVAGVAALLDQSLLRRSVGPGGEPRVGMLETLHEYARERLEAQADEARLRRMHAAYYVALAEEAAPRLAEAGQEEWQGRLWGEIDNLRAALEWARASGEVELGLRLMGAAWRLWHAHGHLSEGRGWLEELLTRPGARDHTDHVGSARVRAGALYAAGWLACEQGDYDHGVARHEESLVLRRALGDPRGIAASLRELGVVASTRGDNARAVPFLEESLALSRESGDRPGVTQALSYLGVAAFTGGDFARAAALFEESLTLGRERGDKRAVAHALLMLGGVANMLGDNARAAPLLDESLALSRDIEDQPGIAYALIGLAGALRAQDDLNRVTALYTEGLALSRSMGAKWLAIHAMVGLAHVALSRGEVARAARLFGVVAALCEATGYRLNPVEHASYERGIAAARAALGDAFAATWAAGESSPLERAIAEALDGS